MIKFIVDTQLPPGLSDYWRAQNHNAKHTTNFPSGHLLKDAEIIRIAIDEERVIITKDRDFLDYYLLKEPPPRVLLLQFGNMGNPALLKLFAANHAQLVGALENGAELILFSEKQIAEYRK